MAIIENKKIYDHSKSDLPKLEKSFDNLIKKEKELIKINKALADSLQAIKKSSDGTEAKKLSDGTDKLTRSTKKLKDAYTAEEKVKQDILRANAKLTQSRTKAAKDLALVRQATLKQNRALNEQAKSQLKVKKGLSGLTKQMFAGVGIIAGFRALGRVISNAIKIYKDFERSSSKLSAILGKNKEEIKALTKQAKLLGSTTAFTAKEVVGLQIELAKLGFSLKEIENSTPGILDLAAATGTDLANAAELAGATLRIFNLDASQMRRVTDVLALSTTKSSLTMEKLATILPIVGKTADIAGLSLEQTAALAGTLTDRGIDASTAATSLRNIFLQLAKQGISWNDAMEQINESTNKSSTSTKLFGVRASSAGVILSETAGSTDELTAALNDADGAAKRMADTMLNNLAGDITKAESAWEGFINSLITGEGVLSKVFRGVTQFFSQLVGELTQLNNGASVALIQLKNVQNFEEKLSSFRERNTKLLKEINTEEQKKIVLEGRAAVLGSELVVIERKLKREKEGSLEISKEEKTQMEFRRDLLKGQISILNTLIPLEKSNNVEIKTSGEENKETAAQLKARIKEEEKLITTLRKKDIVATLDLLPIPIVLTDKQKLEDDKAVIEENARVKKKEADEKEWEEILARAEAGEAAKTAITEAALNAAGQLASDIFASFQDEKLAKINSDAEAEKELAQSSADAQIDILQDRLDKGLISEEQFKAQSLVINESFQSQVAAIEKKQRIESAKAEKKKALFDIAIATAVAVAKAGFITPAAFAILAAGAIQAAVIAAKPLPLNKGMVKVPGQGNTDSVNTILTPGESVINKGATANSEGVLNMINDGLLTDRNASQMLSKQDNNMLLAGLLTNMNDTNKQILQAALNGGVFYTNNGQGYLRGGDGETKNFIP